LNRHPIHAKKSLGQHFLNNQEVCHKMAKAVEDFGINNVFEIGPGTGVLTQHLLSIKGINLLVCELDDRSVEYLKVNYPSLQNKIIAADFLKLDISGYFSKESFILCGNFPYNISSQILFRLLDHTDSIPGLVGMFQREVAMRVCSGPGNKDYGILSVLLQVAYSTEYLFTVDEHDFTPPPKVKSGVIRLSRKENPVELMDSTLFKTLVKTAFNQRRKTLRNALKSMNTKYPESIQQFLDKRAEQLSVEEFAFMSNQLSLIAS
jgi:16S rRNA (adenine1518-N6/adenine1519-N6)-dimethyltransferase